MSTRELIAIIGSGNKFPGGASSPSKLWDLLSQPRDLVKKIPSERFNADAFYHPNGGHHGATNVRFAYTLEEDYRHFDAQFFQTKPVEANSIDPQQRILLETVYEAVEAAGIGIEQLQGTDTAVYVGVMSGDYNDLILKDIDSIPTYLSTGTARSILSNRISYFFDWHGPSMTIDTACSSSLVAVHQAVETLQSGDSRVAIAAGSNLILMPENFIAESNLSMLSPNGRSRMWDVDADGYARGDGFAAVVMKRLSDAIEDGDEIECIIRGSGVNQDGRTKGITMPSSESQAALIRSTYAKAGLDITKESDRPQFFEAHGTGTPAGDPTEARAIDSAFFKDVKSEDGTAFSKLWVGSVKTIIGHTEGTAGLAGLLKASLALNHASIPPNLHLNCLNPSVKPYYKYLEIPTSLQQWPAVAATIPRRASVNSFGFGGTNAHVILESYDPLLSQLVSRSQQTDLVLVPFLFSASTQASLRRLLRSYSAHLKNNKSIDLRDLAHTLASRRSQLPTKVSFYASNIDAVIEKLDALVEQTENPGTASVASSNRILGIFTGQGAQYAQMGRDLILSSQAARGTVERLERFLAELPVVDRPTWSLTDEILADTQTSRLAEATVAQPLCTAIQIVLVDLLRSANITFSAVVGHSSGEIGAAYSAGYLTDREAIYIAYYRGLHSKLAGTGSSKGLMLAVGTSPDDAQELCEFEDFSGRIVVAAINSSASVTLSGDADAIEEAESILKDEKKFARILKVDKAYHSHHMLACSEAYLASLKACEIRASRNLEIGVTWYSSVYGAEISASDGLDGAYWNKNLVNPVLFKQAIEAAVSGKESFDLVIEVGPHPALQGPALQVLADALGKSIPYTGVLTRGKNAVEAFTNGLGSVWNQISDNALNFASFQKFIQPEAPKPKLLKSLPSYSWDHDRVFWHESSLSKAFRTRPTKMHELLGTQLSDGTEHEQRWRNSISLKEVPWLQGHQLQGQPVFPAAGYVAMAIEASLFLETNKTIKTIEISDLTIKRPITFDDESAGVETLFSLTSIERDAVGNTATASFKCFAVASKDAGMVLMAYGVIHLDYATHLQSSLPPRTTSRPDLVDLDTDRFYNALRDLGYGYSGDFRGLSSLKRKLGFGTGLVRNPTSSNSSKSLLVHPGMLDSAFQTLFLAYSWPGDGRLWSLHVPTHISKIRINVEVAEEALTGPNLLSFDCVLRNHTTSAIYGDVDLYSTDNNCALIQIEGMNAVPLAAATAEDDRIVFADIGWATASPDGAIVAANNPVVRLIDPKEVSTNRLASMVSQITNRYPRIQILELAATDPSRSQSILKEIGQAFAKYTFSTDSKASFTILKESFPDHPQLDKFAFELIDVEGDLANQGDIVAKTYDLIIAPLFLYAVHDIQKTLGNLHQLLRPGGFLVALEPVRSSASLVGSSAGQTPHTFLTAAQWSSSLRKAGFSGIDTITPGIEIPVGAVSVFASQALDERISSLRRPLQSVFVSPRSLTIIGGTSLDTWDLAQDLVTLLRQHYTSVEVIESLDVLDPNQIPLASTVLSIVDLDEPTFKNMTSSKLEALKLLFDRAKNVLWLTRGCLADDPFANMIVGFGRTLLLEMSHLRLQFLDISSTIALAANPIAEALLRIQIVDERPVGEILWSTEPELALAQSGLIIPRIYPSQAKNDRYNSSRRPISKTLDLSDSIIAIEHQNGTYLLRESLSPEYEQISYLKSNTNVKVDYSFPTAVKVGATGYLFPVLGHVIGNGKKVIALTEIPASTIKVPTSWVHQYDDPDHADLETLLQVSLFIIATAILAPIASHETIVVHDADLPLATILANASRKRRITAIFTTSKDRPATSGIPWLTIHRNASQRAIEALLPKHITAFVQLSASPDEAVVSLIKKSISPYHRTLDSSSFINSKAVINSINMDDSVLVELSAAIANSQTLESSTPVSFNVLGLAELASYHHNTFSTLFDWTQSGSVSVTVAPVDSKSLFAKDKTYFLAGLAGDLGRSLTKWMVDHGARFVVLTSRNPKVDEGWLKSFEESGATVLVLANDITDRDALRKLLKSLSETLPPIAGVANGAMVLEDTPIADMTVEKMQKVLKPKVEGSLYLDELFPTDNLDFFIFFSSVASVVGNRGQSSYSAANAFMASLAAQRRKRGLAGSVIDIGAIVGTGYLTREVSQSVQDYLRKAGYMWMSESEFLQVFAEGVLAGKSITPYGHEVASGLRMVKDAEKDTVWYSNPRFQHCILNKDSAVAAEDSSNSSLPIKTQLAGAKDQEDLFQILNGAFSAKLQTALLLESVDNLLGRTADDLGVDSLIAVAIRSWFLKEIDVDMPVMKILGGSTVEELLKYAINRISPNLASDPEAPSSQKSFQDEPSTALYQLPKSETPQNPTSVLGPQSSENKNVWTPKSDGSSSSSENDDLGTGATSPSSSVHRNEAKSLSPAISYHPISFGQSRFWFMHYLLDDKTTFNVTCLLRLKGPLRVSDLASAVGVVGSRHEGLRTRFLNTDGEARQEIMEISPLYLEKATIADIGEVAVEFKKTEQHIFELEQGKTMRIKLLALGKADHFLIVSYHHINMDGISFMVLIQDLAKLYSGQQLPPPALQYSKFSTTQRDRSEAGKFKEDLTYWQQEYPDLPPVLPIFPLSTVVTRKPMTRFDSNKAELRIPASIRRQVQETSRSLKVTPFHFYLAVFQALLARFSGASDLSIGIADSGRSDFGAFESIGNYLNLLPLRFRPSLSRKFQDVLKEAKEKAYSAMGASAIPIDLLFNELGVGRTAAHSPLFQAFMDYRNVKESQSFGDCVIEGQEYSIGRTAYDITLDVIDNQAGDSLVSFLVQKDLYTESDACVLLNSFLHLAESFATNPKLTLGQPSLYPKEHIDNSLECCTGPPFEHKWPTLPHAVDEISRENPSKVAITDGNGQRLTYSEMVLRVNSIAESLLSLKLNQEQFRNPRIAVLQTPSTDWICSLLAIQRIGGTYIPLDLKSGLPRLAAIVKESKPSVILVQDDTVQHIPFLGPEGFRTVNVTQLAPGSSKTSPNLARTESTAIILFTSGSTGTPKGISLSHSALQNQMEGAIALWQFKSEIVLQQSAYSFDLSVWQIYLALLSGGTSVTAPAASRNDPVALTNLIYQEGVTATCGVPSEYSTWFRFGDTQRLQESKWRMIVSGGEQFSGVLVQELRGLGKSDLRAVNLYGPAEATVSATQIEVLYQNENSLEERVAAGDAMPNYAIYIMDGDEPVPIGVPGEIVIAGSISSGYTNNDQLNAERFIKNPFVSSDWLAKGWDTMHRSGDRGRIRTSDGALVYEGRIAGDTQIKLNGVRVELRDIESTIVASGKPHVADAIVSLRGQAQYLVAHVVFAQESTVPQSLRRNFLAQLLKDLGVPSYMRPSLILPLDHLPLNVSGKVDRIAISELALPDISSQEESTSTETRSLSSTESTLESLWLSIIPRDISSRHRIDPTTDFFQIGGSSILLINLQSAIKKKFSISIPLVQLFESNSLEQMAAAIKRDDVSNLSRIIDWDVETQLEQELRLAPPVTPVLSSFAAEEGIVVLTGSTGFLGREILRQLVHHAKVTKIYCIALRNPIDQKSPKIEKFRGDLTLPLLGLNEEDAQRIFSSANIIIHNAADVSFLKTYHSLRTANVTSTKELVALAAKYGTGIRFHYVSTAGVGQLIDGDVLEQASVFFSKPPTNGSNGYVATKWASERFLEKASEAIHIPVVIHRPSSVYGDGAPSSDIMQNLLRLSRQLKAVPELDFWSGYIDLVSVHKVSEGILSHALDTGAVEITEYIHQSGEIEIPVRELGNYLQKESGEEFEVVSPEEWVKRAKVFGLDELVASYMLSRNGGVDLKTPRIGK